LPDALSGLFLQAGLDRANQLDAAEEFSLNAHAFAGSKTTIVRAAAVSFHSSCPALCRASTSLQSLRKRDVDGQDKPGRDGSESISSNWRMPENAGCFSITLSR
jgi:hypothetical protein